MTEEEFCIKIDKLKLSNLEKACAILYFYEVKSSCGQSSAAIHKFFIQHGLANPNYTWLTRSLNVSKDTKFQNGKFRLTTLAKERWSSKLKHLFTIKPELVPSNSEYLSLSLFTATREYYKRIVTQINGCYYYGYFDAASVLCRKLFEILIIECFEKHKKESYIKDSSKDFYMLSDLITVLLGPNGFTLGRESKKIAKEVKKIGDRAAHNRRYMSNQTDLDNLKSDFRLLIEELLHIANLR